MCPIYEDFFFKRSLVVAFNMILLKMVVSSVFGQDYPIGPSCLVCIIFVRLWLPSLASGFPKRQVYSPIRWAQKPVIFLGGEMTPLIVSEKKKTQWKNPCISGHLWGWYHPIYNWSGPTLYVVWSFWCVCVNAMAVFFLWGPYVKFSLRTWLLQAYVTQGLLT